MRVILASKSPRRKELLEQIGLSFEVLVSDSDENLDIDIPEEFVKELSRIKSKAVMDLMDGIDENTLIIGADTIVVYDGKILGKPKDEEDAFCMLKMLSDNEHEVITGVTLLSKKNGKIDMDTFFEKTKVFTYEMSDSEIKEYIATKEPMDKAGSYGIQGIGGKFIKKIDGDYNNVVGLPVSRIYQKIKENN